MMENKTEQKEPMKFARTKTLRFKLTPEEGHCGVLTQQAKLTSNKDEPELNQFVNELNKFLKDAEKALFKDEKFKQSVEYKYHFLRTYFKREYYAHLADKPSKVYNLSTYNCFYKKLAECIASLRQIKEGIAVFSHKQSEEKENLQRREVMAHYAKQLSRKSGFQLLFVCLDNLPSKLRDTALVENGRNLQNQINVITEYYLDSHSEGQILTKASLNYHTINKTPKMLDEELDKLTYFHVTPKFTLTREQIEISIKNIDFFVLNGQLFNKLASQLCKDLNLNFGSYKSAIQNVIQSNIFVLELLNNHLKNTKAFYKQALYELASKKLNFDDLTAMTAGNFFVIYKSNIDKDNDRIYWNTLETSLLGVKEIKPFQKVKEEHYTQLKENSGELERLSNQLKTAKGEGKARLKEQLTALKEDRGIIFNRTIKGNNQLDNTFGNLCSLHQKIALKYGQLKAKKKAIEKEKVDSDLLNYWSVITKTVKVLKSKSKQKQFKETYHLVLIPQHQRRNFKDWLEQASSHQNNKSCVYYFESLTYKALEKLCFNHAVTGQRDKLNEFWKGVSNELKATEGKERFATFNRLTKPEKWYKEAQYPENEKEIIEFFKAVLTTNYAKSVLSLPFDMSTITDFDTKQDQPLDKFEQELNKISYQRIVKKEIKRSELSNKYQAQIFKLDNFNFKKEHKNRNTHTQSWFDFWQQKDESNFPLRLNPEISIAYRKPTKDNAYGKESKHYKKEWRNRYRDEQFILRTTFTEDAFSKQYDLAFSELGRKNITQQKKKHHSGNEEQTPNSVKSKIDQFNKTITLEEYAIGLDLGGAELATLALTKGVEKTTPEMFTVYQMKPDKLDFSQDGLAKHGEKRYHLIQNLSYFVNEDLYNKTFLPEKLGNKPFDVLFNELFEEEQVSSCDLTMAKVINGKIFINGDIQTILNLKVLDIKQQLVEAKHEKKKVSFEARKEKNQDNLYFSMGVEKELKFNYQSEFNALPIIQDWQFLETYKMGGLRIKLENKEKAPETPFAFLERYFDEYVEKLEDHPNPLLDKINNYRQNAVANMVGVIHHLYKVTPCYISFENFDIAKNSGELNRYRATVFNTLVDKVINKFYQLGKVPPLKAFYELKSIQESNDKNEGTYNQFGQVMFVSEEDTSKLCPSCNKKAYENEQDKRYKEDKRQKHFSCLHCKFHNHRNAGEFASLNTNDKVAAFNVAKRAMTILNNQEKEKQKQQSKSKMTEPA